MTTGCVADLVETLGSLPLLEKGSRLERVRSLAGRCTQVRDLARELLRRGWLTPFQVNQIFQGRGSDLVIGPYVLLEGVGEGGMGQVYKARHHRLRRVVALKVIRKERVAHPNAVQRFRREVQAVSQLAHPNIVKAYGAGRVGETYFLAMEYVEGIDLAHLVGESGPLQVSQACDYIRQAARGLHHAHQRGLIHRDIKPSNLLVTPPQGISSGLASHSACPWPWGQVKILDLGLVRLPAGGNKGPPRLTRIGSLIGSPDFVAPEQVRNPLTSDIRADLYSLGCTLYVLLSGQVPFVDGNLTSKLLRHQREAPEPVEKVRRDRLLCAATPPGLAKDVDVDTPAEVATVVRKLMAKDPGDRFQTAEDAANALAAVCRSGNDRSGSRPLYRVVGRVGSSQTSGAQAKRPTVAETASASTPML
jgi:serine/threonine-protein kinase